jgi:hypothetical protein
MSGTTNTPARRKRTGGRPTRLTPQTESRILQAVRCGASFKSACVAAGIGLRTFYRWKAEGESEDARPLHRQFWQRLTQAVEEGHVARVATITKASREDWRAAAWLEERLNPQRFSLRHKVEHSGELTVAQIIASLRHRPELVRRVDPEDR